MCRSSSEVLLAKGVKALAAKNAVGLACAASRMRLNARSLYSTGVERIR
jgi:hypothetical protein